MPELQPTMTAVLAAAVGAFESSVDQDGVWLTRYRVLRNATELREAEWARWADWRTAVAEFVAARVGGSPQDVIPSAIAGAVLSAYLAVHNAWATADQEPREPAATLRRELLPVCSALETLITVRQGRAGE
ncbi:hypothetical protein WJ438_07515 [Streptomyces sp. GD-15H]|uniref:acyl-CoA-like ligand-binding transcription factor n=1 Tax=Streptomyces sp. GD-15H TaxID=3129112 RepID=UPI003250D479